MSWFHILAVLLLISLPASAQNVVDVFGPEVKGDEKVLEWRLAVGPGFDDEAIGIGSRIQYDHAVTDNLRLRGLVQGSDTDIGEFEFEFFQAEALWQVLEDEEAGFDAALRFDARISEGDDAPDFVALNFSADKAIGNNWSIRGNVLTSVQLGNDRSDGLFLQTRAALAYKLVGRYRAELQMFNFYGTTANFADFNDQVHTIGPALSGPLIGKWGFKLGALVGVSDAAPDLDLRFFLSRRF